MTRALTSGRCEQTAVSVYLEVFEEVKRLVATETGKALGWYKPTEPERLQAVFGLALRDRARGMSFLSSVLHRLIWEQCLENGNHRTATVFLTGFLGAQGVRVPQKLGAAALREFRDTTNEWFRVSKRLLDAKEQMLQVEKAKREHRQRSHAWLTQVVGNQSIRLAMVGPKSLMAFLRCGESSPLEGT